MAFEFLVSVLGTEGAKALRKAAEKEPSFKNLLVPRTAMAFLADRTFYEGIVPGIPNSYIRFAKNDEGYTGLITLPEMNYSFENVSQEHVAAAISAATNELNKTENLKDVVLIRLGKSIDALAQAQRLVKKVLDPNLGYKISEEHDPDDKHFKVNAHDNDGKHVGLAWFRHVEGGIEPISIVIDNEKKHEGLHNALIDHAKKISGKMVLQPTQKTDLPGQAAQPKKQLEPEKPELPSRQIAKPKLPKPPKLQAIKVEKSDMSRECAVCGGTQFSDDKFKPCLCFQDLKKSFKVVVFKDGYVLEPQSGMDFEYLSAFRAALKGE